MVPYVTDKSEQGWSIRIVLYKSDSQSEKKEQESLNSSRSHGKHNNQNGFKESELKLSRREKYYLHYWLKHQKNSISKQKDLKFKLSEFLIEKKDNVILYLNNMLQSMSLIGSFMKRQYITNTFFLIEVYLTHKQNQEINLFQTIDKYCKIKELPFIIKVEGRSVGKLERIQSLEISAEILLNIFQLNEILTSLTQLMLTGHTKKYFRRRLLQYISENVYIILSNFIDRKAQKAENQSDDPNRKYKQLKIVFQNQKNEEKNIFQDNPELIFQDLPRIFSERIKQQIEPSIYEKMFEKLFNDIYEKNFFNRKNIDIDSIFDNLLQQNNSLKKNVLQENDTNDVEEENNKNGVLQVHQNNSYLNLNQLGEDGLPPSNHMEDSDPTNLMTNDDQMHLQNNSKKNLTRESKVTYGRGFIAQSSTNISKQARNSIKSLQIQRKKILKNIKKIQESQNNLLTQPNQMSSMLSLDSSFVSTQNNIPGSFYFNENNIISMKQEHIIEKIRTNINKIDYYMDWQSNGLFGRFLIQLNEQGTSQLKIINFLPKCNFVFDQITQKQKNIVVNILTYFIDMKVNERKSMINRQTLLKYMLQNIVLKDYQSLTGFRFLPRKPTEFGTHQLILSNNDSVQYHLSLQTKEFLQFYYNLKQTYAQNISNIGKCLVVACSFSINVKDITNKYRILFSISVLPFNSKTAAHRLILSLQDMQSLDPFQVQRILSSKMATSVIHKTFKNILKKSVFLSTHIGKLPIFHSTLTNFSIQLGTPQTSKIRSYKTTNYDGKKISGIYSRNNQKLKTLQNNSNFEDFADSQYNPSKNMKSQSDEDLYQWFNHLNDLRCYRNSMIKSNFDQKVYDKQSNQNFLNEDIIRYRFIYSMSKIFQNEYILVSVFRDLLLQNWLIKFYFPRNCRYLQCHVDSSDLFQASSRFLKRTITNQLIWFYEYEFTEIFSSYLELQRRFNINGMNHRQMRIIEKEKFSPSPLFYSKKGNLFLNKVKTRQSRQGGSIFSQMLDKQASRSSIYHQMSPLQNRSPSIQTQVNEVSISSKHEILSPQNQNFSRFYAEKQAADTTITRKPQLTVRTNNNTGRNQQYFIINEPTVDSQYDLSSTHKKSKKLITSQHQGSFYDYLCKYMQSEKQISPKIEQNGEKTIFDRKVANSENLIQNQRIDSNTNILQNQELNILDSPHTSFNSSADNEKYSPFLKKQKLLNQSIDENDQDKDLSQRFLKNRLQKIKLGSNKKLSTLIQDTEEKEEPDGYEWNSEKKKQSSNKKKKNLKDIILKHFQGFKIVNNLKSIVEYIKPRRHDKINRIEKLKNMTLLQDHSFEETIKQIDRTKNTRAKKEQILLQKKQEKNQRYYEIKIWENIINLTHLKHTCMQLDLGGTGIPLKEIIVSKFLRIDKVIKIKQLRQEDNIFTKKMNKIQNNIFHFQNYYKIFNKIILSNLTKIQEFYYQKQTIIIYWYQILFLNIKQQNENYIEISIDLLEVLQKKNMQIQMQNNGGLTKDFEINFKNLLSQFLETQYPSQLNINMDMIEQDTQEDKDDTNIKTQNNKRQSNDLTIRRIKESERYNSSSKNQKRASGIDYFFPIEYIQYASTSSFNFTISHINLNVASFQDIYLNCREITNVFIAEGYFKYQANYIYSNISYADICNLAQFILYKISNSNFLELLYDKSQQKKIKKEDLNQLKRGHVPSKYNKKNIRFINPQNIVFMYTKTINPKKKIQLRSSISTHDLIFNLEMFQISTKNVIKIQKTFKKMMKHIPFIKQHFEMGEMSYILKHVTAYYEQKMTITWSLKYVTN